MIGSACSPLRVSPRAPLFILPLSPPERDNWSRFIVSNYLLVDRDKRVTSMSERVFREEISRYARLPFKTRGRGKKPCGVGLSRHRGSGRCHALCTGESYAFHGSCSCDTLPLATLVFLSTSQLPTRGPHVSTKYVSLFQFNILPLATFFFVCFEKNLTLRIGIREDWIFDFNVLSSFFFF